MICTFVSSLLMSNKLSVNADDSEVESKYNSYIQEEYEKFLEEHNAHYLDELDQELINEWMYRAEEIKEEFFGPRDNLIAEETGDIINTPVLGDYTGHIFISYDQWLSSWNHGHAAIGYGNGTVEILGPSYTVQQYGVNRVMAFYFSNTGGYYGVYGASPYNYQTAANNAYSLIGTGYLTDGSGVSCSSLVGIAWSAAGFSINGTTPHYLANDSSTYLIYAWDGSYGGITQ